MRRLTIDEEGWWQRGVRWASLVAAFMVITMLGATLAEVMLIAFLLAVNRFYEDRATRIAMIRDLGERIQTKIEEKRRQRRRHDDP